MTTAEIIQDLKKQANPKNVEGMQRFGIKGTDMLGISIPYLRKIAKEVVKLGEDERHTIAQQLWKTKIHEARILASMVDAPGKVGERQMEEWVKDFDSWDVVDQVALNLFSKLPNAYKKAIDWAHRKREFEKRAGFSLMAVLAWHDKMADDAKFLDFFEIIKQEATDERNFVKKAVNWALRQIGKRNPKLRKLALKTTDEILKLDNKAANWIANNAARELEKK
jgi:3-methyladenine DNA glycosylase AlkD